MAGTAFSRFTHLRNLANINNASVFGTASNTTQRFITTSRYYASINDQLVAHIKDELDPNQKSKKKMSKAMKVYLQRAKEHEEFMKKEIAKYEIGKRHLANMMGKDSDNFTQADIDKSIEYLFPSGLYDWRARPMMRPACDIFPSRKEAEFDQTGRPFHSMFYTTRPNYYEMLYNIVDALTSLNLVEDKYTAKGELTSLENKIDTLGSCWLTKPELESLLLETLTDSDYEYFLTSIGRLVDHPFSINATDVIMKYRKQLTSLARNIELLPTEYDANGRPFVRVPNCTRKSSIGEVIVWGNGTGSITINGQSIMYFDDLQCREQIIFPLIFTNMENRVDIEATVSGGGPTGQSGAIRWGIAWGLRNFVNGTMVEKMRIAGLLTRDWRRRERKKPGQEGARRKFTWNKR